MDPDNYNFGFDFGGQADAGPSSTRRPHPLRRELKRADPETHESLAARMEAARILASNEMLIWYSMARDETLPQTRLHFQRILANLPAPPEPPSPPSSTASERSSRYNSPTAGTLHDPETPSARARGKGRASSKSAVATPTSSRATPTSSHKASGPGKAGKYTPPKSAKASKASPRAGSGSKSERNSSLQVTDAQSSTFEGPSRPIYRITSSATARAAAAAAMAAERDTTDTDEDL